jgi:dethiobiotin synthetase
VPCLAAASKKTKQERLHKFSSLFETPISPNSEQKGGRSIPVWLFELWATNMSDDDGGAAVVEGDGGLAEVESTRTLFVEVTHTTDRYWQLPRSI